jgi:hypothetical protein
MPFVLISGHEVRFATFTEEPTEYAGEETESFWNTPLSSRAHPRKRWTGTTIGYTPGEMAVVRALAGNGFVRLACSGTAFEGATPTCLVAIGPVPYVRDRKAADGFLKQYQFSFKEA